MTAHRELKTIIRARQRKTGESYTAARVHVCLHGLGLCHWRLGRAEQAQSVFERILALNPSDTQSIRFLREALLAGRTWEDFREDEIAVR